VSRAKPAQHRICGGIFTPDIDMPAEPFTGRKTCRCGLVGQPGDTHHTVPEPTQDVRGLAAGERSEG
jgi:hypothetical protein